MNEKLCTHVSARTGERCSNEVWHEIPSLGLCVGHYQRKRRGSDMDKPFRRLQPVNSLVQLPPIRIRKFLVDLLHEEAAKAGVSFYHFSNDVIEKRFSGHWKTVPQYHTKDRGNMVAGNSFRLTEEMAELLTKEAEKTERSRYELLQDIIEEWAEKLCADREMKNENDRPQRLAT